MEHQMIAAATTTTNNNSKRQSILSKMHRNSQTILSKNKPQVRIIHIFAPEIIKTDPANFRELVQRLTGKPTGLIRSQHNKRGWKKKAREEDGRVERVKSEEAAEIWRSSSSSAGSGDNESGGFLSGFADLEDGFMQQLGPFQSPLELLPHINNPVLMHHHHHHRQHHFFGEEENHQLA